MVSIKKALTLPATLLVAICWITVSIGIYFYTANLLQEAFKKHTWERSKNLLATIQNDFITGNYLRIRGQFSNFVRQSESDFVMITDNRGVPIEWFSADSQNRQSGIPLELVDSVFGKDHLVYKTPLVFRAAQNQQWGTLVVAHNKKGLNAQLRQLLVFLGVMLIVALMSQTFILNFVSQRILRPLLQLISSIKISAKERWMLPLTVQSSIHEFGELKIQYNEMIQRVQNSQAEKNKFEQLATMGQIAAQVAHDIRSPLSSMKTAMEYFSGTEFSDPRATDYLNLLELSAKRLTGVADGLLKKYKGGAPQTVVFSLHKILDELAGEFKSQEKYHAITFTKKYCPHSIELCGEPEKLQRAFGNIIKNAMEAMGYMGDMVLTTAVENGTAVIGFQDAGPGMSPEKLERVLAGGCTEGKEEGHGIGLTVVRETVKEFGGSLRAQSQEGRGTTFFIGLPLPSREVLKDSPREEAAMEEFNLSVFEKEPVIVIDDDPSIREQWRLVLEANKRGVILCESHEDFERQKISTQISKTAVIDYHFDNSEMNGAEVVRKLQEQNFTNLYLCTAEYWKPSIQKLAKELNVQLCPKPLPKISLCIEPNDQKERRGYKVLVIDDDETIRLAWELMDRKLQIQKLHTFANLEAMEAARKEKGGIDLATVDIAFVDKNIPGSQFTGAQVVAYLKAKGVPKVILASGEDSGALRQDPEFAQADFIVSEKIPQSFREFFS